jgi:hypothetical protein
MHAHTTRNPATVNTETKPATIPKPRPEDVNSPDAIVKAMYECISGPAGKHNWQRLRSLYLEGGRLIPTGKRLHGDSGLRVMNINEWIEDVQEFFAENDFYETEVMRHMDRFGDIIQAFSTYETRNQPDVAPMARGINVFQLLKHEGRWWIVTVIWANESKDNPIPGEFMPYLW